jgi:transglutaminase-like putative cysteine protease
MKYRIRHETEYTYAEPVSLVHNIAHLRPRSAPRQVTRRCAIHCAPMPAVWDDKLDYFGNTASYFILQERHTSMILDVESEVDVEPAQTILLDISTPWEQVRDALPQDRTAAGLDVYQFSFDSDLVPRVPDVVAYAQPSFPPGRPILTAASDLCHRIHSDFTYDPTTTSVATPLRQVLEQRSGVCQDFAHLMIGCMRSLGLPCRYISGYLRTFRDPAQRLVGADASHAWCSVYCPRLGWVDFDPTNDQIPSDLHVTVAWGRDFADVSPLRGLILGGGEHTVDVRVSVSPL